jgi:hypothetical protein
MTNTKLTRTWVHGEKLAKRVCDVAAHCRVETHHERQAALREMDHGRVEIGALVECRHDDAAGKGGRHLQTGRGQYSGSSSGVCESCDSSDSFAAEACLPRRTTRTASSSAGLRGQTDGKEKVAVVEESRVRLRWPWWL